MKNYDLIADNDYLLLTPGPLSTSKRVRFAMLKDLCTWDDDYNQIVQDIRNKLLDIGFVDDNYTSILMQGSGTFGVESVFGSVLHSKVLILSNGAYGRRMAEIAKILKIPYLLKEFDERQVVSAESVLEILEKDKDIDSVCLVHCETTTGILNPLEEIAAIVKSFNKTLIVDGMSSFGGIEIDVQKLGIDFLISSANKCIQGVPGFSFVIAKKEELEKAKSKARSLSLDLYDQWRCMENGNGKWRFTSPTHSVRAFYEALGELEDEGGVVKRFKRYSSMQKHLVKGMKKNGYECYIDERLHSPIITTFLYPSIGFIFKDFYVFLKSKGFVIYPGKLSGVDTFRIGNIGAIELKDIESLLKTIASFRQ
ncbi:2-aminoethylphosphonate--pyruvate transaminase [Helicobacter sp. 13S00477-4]|uniref:2-aminoethylphosphonate--pyruvate transaminase n=1 Tax=Helicobacter sp. 13S00477-4 TaxID=1905759 RepID=UPI000BA6E7E2|nr:2-aminoethylphosphonate--pyruvate transaminase [Helicobacter sp. 13S00477-4]PAF52844.1 2-aminoethylphosphonate--pyruvate transaminase [Helicobacter sp. 13S00477-4]